MPAQQQQQPKPFTPGFAAAFKSLTNLAGTTPERLAAEHKDLTPAQRLEKLKQKFNLMQSLQFSPVAVEKMTAFLTTLNESMQDPELAQQLKAINAMRGNNRKMTELKKLFLDKKVVEASANYWNMYIKSQYRNKAEEMREVFDANSFDAFKAIDHVDSQGNYDPEKKVVRDLMRLLYELFDILLIQAGYQAVFVPHNKEHGSGFWDPNKGIMFPD